MCHSWGPFTASYGRGGEEKGSGPKNTTQCVFLWVGHPGVILGGGGRGATQIGVASNGCDRCLGIGAEKEREVSNLCCV